ncbi:acyl-homoserine-lactone synthase [Pseudomonas sp. KNUC1026]|uniref:acyl-homoserine-lactone synthase n=1 Tax=Pseudomonas sp. KNUC1026 TaxID=2893890 RepID=UPI001F28FB92|nr:acyl-homoserine-lactone synthase [Pseudomonas sp. KNUC1026]UFH50569.1 acyl-homoserine-lactone synthase [Pseudomonas sp. KNUC1026]
MEISIRARHQFSHDQLFAMHRLRAQVFKIRKQWDVALIGDMEIDGYDALDPYYMMLENQADVIGCWRLLPTSGPNMLADTFPELLDGTQAPADAHTWELSRFAIQGDGTLPAQLSQTTTQAIRSLMEFGVNHSIARYVTVTTVGVERLLKRLGLDFRRMGAARTVGVEHAVALEVWVSPKTLTSLGLDHLVHLVQPAANSVH